MVVVFNQRNHHGTSDADAGAVHHITVMPRRISRSFWFIEIILLPNLGHEKRCLASSYTSTEREESRLDINGLTPVPPNGKRLHWIDQQTTANSERMPLSVDHFDLHSQWHLAPRLVSHEYGLP